MFFEESDDPGPCVGAILRFGETMALVLIAQVLDLPSAGTKGGDDLLGLLHRDPRIVRAVNDHERRLNPVDEVERRDRLEEIGIFIRIAVLRRTERPAPRRGLREKALEARDTD